MLPITVCQKILLLAVLAILPFFSFSSSWAGEWKADSFTNNFGTRDYRLFVPSHYNKKANLPLLVGLHGCMNPAEQFAGLTEIELLAEKNNLLVLLPEQSLLANLNLCWNWSDTSNQLRNSGEPELIIGIINETLSSHSIARRNIFAFGVSAGGSMVSILLSTYPDYFRAGLVASGTMYKAAETLTSGFTAASFGSHSSPQATAKFAYENILKNKIKKNRVPVLVFHGDQDGTAHPQNATQTVKQFLYLNNYLDDGVLNNSISLRPSNKNEYTIEDGYTYKVWNYNDLSKKIIVKYVLVKGMGHGWSGGNDKFIFNFPKGPSETEIMWQFFKEQM